MHYYYYCKNALFVLWKGIWFLLFPCPASVPDMSHVQHKYGTPNKMSLVHNTEALIPVSQHNYAFRSTVIPYTWVLINSLLLVLCQCNWNTIKKHRYKTISTEMDCIKSHSMKDNLHVNQVLKRSMKNQRKYWQKGF